MLQLSIRRHKALRLTEVEVAAEESWLGEMRFTRSDDGLWMKEKGNDEEPVDVEVARALERLHQEQVSLRERLDMAYPKDEGR